MYSLALKILILQKTKTKTKTRTTTTKKSKNQTKTKKHCPSIIFYLKLPDSCNFTAVSKSQNFLSTPSPSVLAVVHPFWGGENLAICSHILTKVNLAHLLFTDFLATK